MKKKKGIGRLKAAAAVTCAALTVSSVPIAPAGILGNAAGENDYFICGDVLRDGTVGASDAAYISQFMLKMVELTDNEKIAADADSDGSITVADLVAVLAWTAFPNPASKVGDYIRLDGTPDTMHLGTEFELRDSVTETKNAGFTGDAYVNPDNKIGSAFSLRINADMAGVYKLRIRYANGSEADRKMYASINRSTDAYTLAFPSTGAWESWTTAYLTVKLEQGTNEILFISATDDGGPNVDYIKACRTILPSGNTTKISSELVAPPTEVTTTTTTATTVTETPTEPPVIEERYYAVDSEYVNGVSETLNEGYAGEAYLNYNNEIGSYNIWTVNVPSDGNYKVSFRYANGTDADRQMKISINGVSDYYLMDFNGTGAWNSWTENSVVLPLKAGKNTIKAASATSNGGPNMDYIVLEKTDDAPVSFETEKEGRQVENLSRGVSAAYTGSGVLVSWRILATDSPDTTFRLYKNGQTPPIYEGSVSDASCYLDKSGTASDWYTIDTFVNGAMTEFAQTSINLPNKNSGQSGAYFDIPLDKPAALTMPDGSVCTYSANDASVGDVDGDGNYEIILKWDPSNSQDNSKDGYTGNVYFDCYKLDGTKLWRIDLGKNIRAGAHYTQFMVYDYDGDGKAEMVCKTADGTVDGKGGVVGDASKDYREASGRIISGPEYLTLFDGETGKALDTIDYKPARGNVSSWGDSWGNRVDRFLAATAYLDGQTPSVIMVRGYYTRMAAVAYDVVNKKLVERWTFDTGFNSAAAGYGDGNHNCMPADVDGDGKDELVMGASVIDDNGKILYATGFGHGDALHVGDLDPNNEGLEIAVCHEASAANFGISIRDAKTGKLLFKENADGDTGRCVADNLVPGNSSAEICGSHNAVVYDASGNKVCNWSDITKWNQNSVIYWTDVLERAVLDRTMIDQYGKGRVFTGDASYNNGTKANASITCDLFGDWREELVFPANDSSVLRVFGTTYTTSYPIYTLMHNTQYRTQVAGQNVAYNQPPHTDYFLGTGFALPEAPQVYCAE